MDTEATRKLVLDYLAAQAAGDGERVAELLDDNVRWTPPQSVGFGAPTGRDEVLRIMAEAGAKYFDLPTMEVDVKWMVAEGDKMVIRQRAQATATNGRVYANEYVWVYVCRDGKIVEIEEHTDSLHFKQVVLD